MNFEEWKIEEPGELRHVTIRHYSHNTGCEGECYAEWFGEAVRCFSCGEFVPDEFVFIAELAGAYVPNLGVQNSARARWSKIHRHPLAHPGVMGKTDEL